MGISIAYQGKLSSPSLVPELVADLRARAEAAGWLYKEMPTLLAEGIVNCPGLTGLSLYPHKECEPVRFHFDAEGVFVNHFYQSLLSPDSEMARMMREALVESAMFTRHVAADLRDAGGAGAGGPGLHVAVAALPDNFGSSTFIQEGRRYNWTKTQFAGPDVHIAVCEVLRHVKVRYAPDLEIKDDSGYFESGDRDALLGQLAYTEHVAATAANAFQSVVGSKTPPATLGGLLDRVNDELAAAKDKLH